MHMSVMEWVARQPETKDARAVLELGSRDINGSVRELFPNAASYAGIDAIEGKGVDVRARAAWLPFPDEAFDLVVSTEMLEHDLTFWFSIEEAYRVLKPGGYLLLTCRGLGFPPHEYPGDYYRFTAPAVAYLLRLLRFEVLSVTNDPQYPGVFARAWRPASVSI